MDLVENIAAMAVTEILWMRIDPAKDLADSGSNAGKAWSELKHLAAQSPGFLDQTWCRGYEDPHMVRFHIVRSTLEEHTTFAKSSEGQKFHAILKDIIEPNTEIEIQHVALSDFSENALKAPITGTALYLSTNEIFTTLVWPLWTHIVRHKRGFRGLTTGKVLDHKSGQECYLVYAGWDSLEAHREYWEGEDIRNKDGILDMGNGGRTEFYHLVFEQG